MQFKKNIPMRARGTPRRIATRAKWNKRRPFRTRDHTRTTLAHDRGPHNQQAKRGRAGRCPWPPLCVKKLKVCHRARKWDFLPIKLPRHKDSPVQPQRSVHITKTRLRDRKKNCSATSNIPYLVRQLFCVGGVNERVHDLFRADRCAQLRQHFFSQRVRKRFITEHLGL